MTNNQNPFVIIVNAYYQAEAYSKKYIAKGIFGDTEILPELENFRNFLIESSPIFAEAIKEEKNSGKQGLLEKAMINNDFIETYKLNQIFTDELDNSVNQYVKKGGNMTSYRISFQMGSDTIHSLVGSTIPHLGPHIDIKDGIYKMVNDILTQNYWEGDDLIQNINFIKALNTQLHLSHNWIKEYTYQMLTT